MPLVATTRWSRRLLNVVASVRSWADTRRGGPARAATRHTARQRADHQVPSRSWDRAAVVEAGLRRGRPATEAEFRRQPNHAVTDQPDAEERRSARPLRRQDENDRAAEDLRLTAQNDSGTNGTTLRASPIQRKVNQLKEAKAGLVTAVEVPSRLHAVPVGAQDAPTTGSAWAA